MYTGSEMPRSLQFNFASSQLPAKNQKRPAPHKPPGYGLPALKATSSPRRHLREVCAKIFVERKTNRRFDGHPFHPFQSTIPAKTNFLLSKYMHIDNEEVESILFDIVENWGRRIQVGANG
jgi:hypothetical protein